MRILVALVVVLLSPGLARAEPREWPGLAKEKIGDVALGDSADAAQKKLGKPTKKDKPFEEAATGEIVSDWKFASGVVVTMTAAKIKGPFTVRAIHLGAPSKLKNAEGIGVGSALDEVKKAYGKFVTAPDDGRNGWLVGTPYGGMLLTVEGGKVTEIFLGPMAE